MRFERRFRSHLTIVLTAFVFSLLCTAAHAAEAVPEVPEPGSMVALMTGVIGLVGFIKRRRS